MTVSQKSNHFPPIFPRSDSQVRRFKILTCVTRSEWVFRWLTQTILTHKESMCKKRDARRLFCKWEKILWTRYVVYRLGHFLLRQAYIRTQFNIIKLLRSMKQCGLDEVKNLPGWVTDLWQSGCKAALPAVRLDATLRQTPPVRAVSLTITQLDWRKLSLDSLVVGLQSSCSLTLRGSFLFVVFLPITVSIIFVF